MHNHEYKWENQKGRKKCKTCTCMSWALGRSYNTQNIQNVAKMHFKTFPGLISLLCGQSCYLSCLNFRFHSNHPSLLEKMQILHSSISWIVKGIIRKTLHQKRSCLFIVWISVVLILKNTHYSSFAYSWILMRKSKIEENKCKTCISLALGRSYNAQNMQNVA